MYNYLDFEKPVQDLELKILELKKLAENGEAVDVGDEISRLEKRVRDALRDIYKALTPWQKVQVARHTDRPHCLDYIKGLFSDFTPKFVKRYAELGGDVTRAVEAYAADVRARRFPGAEHVVSGKKP